MCCSVRRGILALTFVVAVLLTANVHVFNVTLLLIQPQLGSSNASLKATQSAVADDRPLSPPAKSTTATAPPPPTTTTTPKPPELRTLRPEESFQGFRANVAAGATEPSKNASTSSTPMTASASNETVVPGRNVTDIGPGEEDQLAEALSGAKTEEELEEELWLLEVLGKANMPALRASVRRRREAALGPSPIDEHHKTPVHLSPHLTAASLAGYGGGALVALVPVALAVEGVGLRLVVAVLGTVVGLASAAAHGALVTHPSAFVAVRIVQGFGVAALMPLAGSSLTSWARLKEYGTVLALLVSADEVAQVFTYPIAAALAAFELDWPWLCYALGVVTMGAVGLWALLYRNHPARHPRLTGLELDRILDRKLLRGTKRAEPKRKPWSRIFCSSAAWLCLVSAFGHLLPLHVLLFYTPSYLHHGLGFSLPMAMSLAALPPAFDLLAKLPVDSLLKGMKDRHRTLQIRLLGGVGHTLCGTALLGLAFVPRTQPWPAVILLCVAYASLGLHLGGWMRSAILAIREAAPLVFFLAAGLSHLTAFLLPFLVGEALNADSEQGWQIVFLSAGGVSLAAGFVWMVLGSAQPDPWTRGFERYFKGAPKLLDPVGENDDDAVSLDQGILELKTLHPLPDPSASVRPDVIPVHR